ncbi:MAG: COX15/CtaA family protein [Limnohabitans sp.]
MPYFYEKTAARPLPVRLYLLTVLTLLSVFMQTGLGAWVSSNYAVLACDTYPMCQNSWWPEMNLSKAFELWRPLGQDASGQALPFQALTAIHMVHRWHAVVPALLILWVARAWLAMGLRKQSWLLIGVLCLQFVTGISNVVLDWPMLAALMHTGSAAVLLVLLTWVLAITQPRKADSIAATFDRNML